MPKKILLFTLIFHKWFLITHSYYCLLKQTIVTIYDFGIKYNSIVCSNLKKSIARERLFWILEFCLIRNEGSDLNDPNFGELL